MDYLISIDKLQTRLDELDTLKGNITKIESEANDSLSSISATEIGILYRNITGSVNRLSNAYATCSAWLGEYTQDFQSLENKLGNFSDSALDSPIEFKGEFVDMFAKKVIPTLKTGGDQNANLKLGEQNTFVDSVLSWAYGIAGDNSHGYSMARRNSGVDYDCSSFVTYALEQAGIKINRGSNALTTHIMRERLLETGQFEWIPGPVNPNSLQAGDIILDIDSHVEMYAGNGNVVGARGGDDDGVYGDSNGSEIVICLKWNWVYGWKDNNTNKIRFQTYFKPI